MKLLDCAWSVAEPSAPPGLGDDEVHLWRVPLKVSDSARAALAERLAPDEVARAARLRVPRDRERFVAAHGWLRAILAGYQGVDASALRFRIAAAGKPELESGPLAFNLSHAGELALVAVARRAVGVDLETLRPMDDLLDIAGSHFSAGECAALARLRPRDREELFFALWTVREAYLKATGHGLAGLESVAIDVAEGAPMGLRAVDAARWTVHRLRPDVGSVGALVVDDPALRVRCLSPDGA